MRTLRLFVFVIAAAIGATAGQGQNPWDDASVRLDPVGQTPVVFLRADTVDVLEDGGRVALMVTGLDAERSYGVILVAPNGTQWIEVHDVDKPFPPDVRQPYDPEGKPNHFLVVGNPGQSFWVSMRGDGAPSWDRVTIPGDIKPEPPEPPTEPDKPEPPPPGLFEDITQLSASCAAKLDDPNVATELRIAIVDACDAIKEQCAAGVCPTVPAAKAQVVAAIEQSLLNRERADRDWLNGWRIPVGSLITQKNPADLDTYVAMMRAAAKGLQ